MPLTRRKAVHNTRSTGRGTHPRGIQKKRKRNVSDSFSRETPTDRSDHHWGRFDLRHSLGNRAFHWAKKVSEIAEDIFFWFLSKELPVVNIIAGKFREPYRSYTVLVTLVIFMAYVFNPWQLIRHVIFPATVSPGIYHNDVLRPPQHSWIVREEDVSIITEGINRLSEVHKRKEYTTIRADNVSCLLSSLWDAIEAVVREKRDPSRKVDDIKKQISDEYKFEMFLKENGRIKYKKLKLKVLCNKLVEVLENTRLPV